CGLLALSLPGHGQGRPAPPAAGAKPNQPPVHRYHGVASCVRCHTKPTDVPGEPPVLCRCDEVERWAKHDKHKDAYGALTGETAKAMAKLLGYDQPAHEKAECLSCHAVAADEKLRGKNFKLSDGVSCVVCHGAYEDWIDLHGSDIPERREAWRG